MSYICIGVFLHNVIYREMETKPCWLLTDLVVQPWSNVTKAQIKATDGHCGWKELCINNERANLKLVPPIRVWSDLGLSQCSRLN